MKDWHEWHAPYADPTSSLSHRLALVQHHIDSWLDVRTGEALTIVSACAGDGRDVLSVLAARANASAVRVTLIEHDGRNAAVARTTARAAALCEVRVLEADAGDLSSYKSAVPADLMVMAGVFGNISDRDVRRTIRGLPCLCAAGATVIWTRSRRAPDLTPTIRRWFALAGFVEVAFEAPIDAQFSVGVHRLVADPQPLRAGRLFTFEQ